MAQGSKDHETYPSIRKINFRLEGSRNISFGPVILMGLAHSDDTFITENTCIGNYYSKNPRASLLVTATTNLRRLLADQFPVFNIG